MGRDGLGKYDFVFVGKYNLRHGISEGKKQVLAMGAVSGRKEGAAGNKEKANIR